MDDHDFGGLLCGREAATETPPEDVRVLQKNSRLCSYLGWTHTTSPSAWKRVTWYKSGGLCLNFIGTKAVLSESQLHLPVSLRELHLSRVQMTCADLVRILGYVTPALRILTLDHNNIQTFPMSSEEPHYTLFPPDLEELNLSNNLLKSPTVPVYLPSNLRVLNLSNNTRLADSSNIVLPPSLNYLQLDNVNLLVQLGQLPQLIPRLPPHVQTLWLQRNYGQIQSFSFHSIGQYLKVLHLDSSRIPSLCDVTFPRSLEKLDLSRCGLELLTRVTFPSTLQCLYLNYNIVQAFVDTSLPANLQIFELEGNCVEHVSSLPTMPPNLTILNLSANMLESVDDLEVPSTVKELVLSHNRIASFASLRIPYGVRKLYLHCNKLQNRADLPRVLPTSIQKTHIMLKLDNTMPCHIETLYDFLLLRPMEERRRLRNVILELWMRTAVPLKLASRTDSVGQLWVFVYYLKRCGNISRLLLDYACW